MPLRYTNQRADSSAFIPVAGACLAGIDFHPSRCLCGKGQKQVAWLLAACKVVRHERVVLRQPDTASGDIQSLTGLLLRPVSHSLRRLCCGHASGQRSSFSMRRGRFPSEPVPIEGRGRYVQAETYVQRRPESERRVWREDHALASIGRFQHAFLFVFDDTFPLRPWLRGPDANMGFQTSRSPGFRMNFFSLNLCDFDLERGLLVFQAFQGHAAALVAIGAGDHFCVLFCGVMRSRQDGRLLRFCQPVDRSAWRNSKTEAEDAGAVRGPQSQRPQTGSRRRCRRCPRPCPRPQPRLGR